MCEIYIDIDLAEVYTRFFYFPFPKYFNLHSTLSSNTKKYNLLLAAWWGAFLSWNNSYDWNVVPDVYRNIENLLDLN